MKKFFSLRVCMLQPYLTPYRVGLFDDLSRLLQDQLTLLYYSKKEESRKWNVKQAPRFKEHYLKTRVKRVSYDNNTVKLNLFSLFAAMARICPDVVICNVRTEGRMIRLLQPFFRYRIIVWTEMTEVVLRGSRLKKLLVKFFDKGVDAYIVPGKMSLAYVTNIRGYKGRVYFAPNTIDRTRFASSEDEVRVKFKEEELRFLFSGNLIPRKGIDSLLSAFERLAIDKRLPAYRLDIIGEGPMEKKPVGNVYYHGFLSQQECAEFMKKAHVFVLPSLWDCNPLVVTEAVTAGCVTVLSDGVGNYPEYTDGNGYVFKRGNVDALYDILFGLLRLERSSLKRMARKSLKISANVSHENSAKVFMTAINECLKLK